MNPLVIPASTITTALAGAVTVIVVWATKQFGNIDVPTEVAGAFTTIVAALTCQFTTDTPPAHPAPSADLAHAASQVDALSDGKMQVTKTPEAST